MKMHGFVHTSSMVDASVGCGKGPRNSRKAPTMLRVSDGSPPEACNTYCYVCQPDLLQTTYALSHTLGWYTEDSTAEALIRGSDEAVHLCFSAALDAAGHTLRGLWLESLLAGCCIWQRQICSRIRRLIGRPRYRMWVAECCSGVLASCVPPSKLLQRQHRIGLQMHLLRPQAAWHQQHR